VTRAIRPMPEAVVRKARLKFLAAIEEAQIHCHLRTYSNRNGPDWPGWYITFSETPLCGTDRCIKLWVVKE